MELDTKHLTQFRSTLSQIGTLSERSWLAFIGKMCYRKINKSSWLIEEGTIENYVHFLLSGAVMVYVKHEGREVCTNFRFHNDFTCSFTSMITRAPSRYWIQAIHDTETLSIHYQDLENLYANHMEINTMGRRMMALLLIDKRQREVDFLTLSAHERYDKLLDEHPQLIQEIPLKHLASFLGITPESLSRIRAKY